MDKKYMTFQPSVVERAGISIFHFINKYVPWFKLPTIIGAFNLAFLRIELRGYNLHDGYADASYQGNEDSEPLKDDRYLTARHSDGKFNELKMPRMGCTGMRFGRNFPREHTQKPTEEELWTPNPRYISEQFMARKEGDFKPATTLNLLAAAWIQFQTHDWFNHEIDHGGESFDVPLRNGDEWEGHMMLPKTKPDATLHPSDLKCPGYKNINTAWWDGSQIYGSNEELTNMLRNDLPDGKLRLNANSTGAFIPRGEDGNPLTGFNDNWWVGMEMLHTLFALEHNSLCDMFKKEYPDWTGDQIFDKARLVNSALMAKIHTVEWTPAILAHPILEFGMNTNWWGVVGEKLTRLLGRVSKDSEIISGIPGSGVDHDRIPYSLTEEFVSVYRMHSLVPDKIAFFEAKEGKHQATIPIVNLTFKDAQKPLDQGLSFGDLFYSFGINYPGAITNNNYPNFLRDLHTPEGLHRDMGTVDILRDRERGVPRYCAFRRMLRMKVPATFEELTGGNKELAARLSEAYNGKLKAVDVLVGSHSEPLIPGFGFSETAFRIFIVMASRRLTSDRFIAGQWNKATYTKQGLHWVQCSTMKDVLIRHFPGLGETLKHSKNAFAPWVKKEGSKGYDGIETNAK
ncbi:Alpha-dioxygenase 2 [Beauveria bassiana]|uniref:Feebly protein n=1 Tax=Beauveria bassiana (strain ARSEF 2860) TaxID=655819 RepID=J4UIJ1_BEAB2|nr:feebly protein [Beauveria bassiana ARSEF 2860]EJP63377.1 feebly protein [Beauveria bassiana ARSEF 2860]KAF1730310.1 Alpha-dioxygenase 2 [Beauveria bassiana]KAH8708065.1 Alpha-dioxygenase 2 [Beauveria bassiana]